MIKSQDKTPVPNHHSSCFAENDTSSGIAFERSDGSKRFAPHSFLSSVDFDGKCELIFRYTFGTITVQGQALEPLWNALCRGTLAGVIEQAGEPSGQDGIFIRAIIVEDDESSCNGPVFPEKSGKS